MEVEAFFAGLVGGLLTAVAVALFGMGVVGDDDE